VATKQGIAPGQELVFRADMGGFDAGSQFSWNVLCAYSFTFAVRNGVTYSSLLGYRALSVKRLAPRAPSTDLAPCRTISVTAIPDTLRGGLLV